MQRRIFKFDVLSRTVQELMQVSQNTLITGMSLQSYFIPRGNDTELQQRLYLTTSMPVNKTWMSGKKDAYPNSTSKVQLVRLNVNALLSLRNTTGAPVDAEEKNTRQQDSLGTSHCGRGSKRGRLKHIRTHSIRARTTFLHVGETW
jgi:hypothetical protein